MLQQTLFQKIESFKKKIFDPSRKRERNNFYHLQIFYYASLKFHLKLATFKKLEEISSTPPTHLEMDFYFLCILANSKPSLKLKDLSLTHLKLSMN